MATSPKKKVNKKAVDDSVAKAALEAAQAVPPEESTEEVVKKQILEFQARAEPFRQHIKEIVSQEEFQKTFSHVWSRWSTTSRENFLLKVSESVMSRNQMASDVAMLFKFVCCECHGGVLSQSADDALKFLIALSEGQEHAEDWPWKALVTKKTKAFVDKNNGHVIDELKGHPEEEQYSDGILRSMRSYYLCDFAQNFLALFLQKAKSAPAQQADKKIEVKETVYDNDWLSNYQPPAGTTAAKKAGGKKKKGGKKK